MLKDIYYIITLEIFKTAMIYQEEHTIFRPDIIAYGLFRAIS